MGGGSGLPGSRPSTSGLRPRPADEPLAALGLDDRQVGADFEQEPFVARDHQAALGAEAHHGQVVRLRPALGRAQEPAVEAQPGRVEGRAGRTRPGRAGQAARASSLDAVRLAFQSVRQSDSARASVARRTASRTIAGEAFESTCRRAGRGAGGRRRSSARSPAGAGRGSSPATGHRAWRPSRSGSPGRSPARPPPPRPIASRTTRLDRPSLSHQSSKTSTAPVATSKVTASTAISSSSWSPSRPRSLASSSRRAALLFGERGQVRGLIGDRHDSKVPEVQRKPTKCITAEAFFLQTIFDNFRKIHSPVSPSDDDGVEQGGVPEFVAVLQGPGHLAGRDGVVDLGRGRPARRPGRR